ncbi:CD109 antigen [Trichoplax sp. H2]|nr:CD109 antigen [Trichoplax sp. H2]|eukprot:RDD47011.1 CD109 antigen [Trichoplax sp. H2]
MVNRFILSAFFLLILGVASVSAIDKYDNGTYIITAPAIIRPGLPTMINVNILRAPQAVTTTAKIVSKNGTIMSQNSDTFYKGTPKSMTLQVPKNLKDDNYVLLVQSSGGLSFSQNKSIKVNTKTSSLFIQTDKAIYKPGQTIRFRLISTDMYLKPKPTNMTIEILDPNKFILTKWSNLRTTDLGILTKDYPLADEPPLGKWTLRIVTKDDKAEKSFEIKEYVLPRFNTKVTLPSFGLNTDDKLTISISAKYTYGMPVKGVAYIKLNPKYWYSRGSKIPEIRKEEKIDGYLNISVPTSDIKWHLNKNKELNYFNLLVNVIVMEKLTSIKENGTSSMTYYSRPYRVNVVSSTSAFRPGMPYHAMLAVVQPDGKAVAASLSDYLTVRTEYGNGHTTVKQLQSKYGLYKLSWNIPSNATTFYFNAYYGTKSKYSWTAYHYPSMWRSNNKEYIQLVNTSSSLKIGSTATFDVLSSKGISGVRLTFEVTSRGAIVASGSLDTTGQKTSLSFTVTQKMAPTARVLAYYIGDNYEVIGDSYQFQVDGLFENKVSLNFDKSTEAPGKNIKLKVKASPYSHVGVLAVDQSVLLMKTGNDLSVADVKKEIQSYGGNNYYPDYPIAFKRSVEFKRTVMPGGGYYSSNSMKGAFKQAGLVILTDALVSGSSYPPMYMLEDGAMAPNAQAGNADLANKEEGGEVAQPLYVRTFFPETWLWSDKNASSSGEVVINSLMPDTITSWVASAFAVSSATGFGLSPTHAKVTLVLESSSNWQNIDLINSKIIGSGSQQYQLLVKAGQAASTYFPIMPMTIGSIPILVKASSNVASDAVVRQLRVEPEGIKQHYTENYMIQLSNGGDLMGPSISNLDNLLQMPYGCGEQNMLGFAPDIYISKYLTATNQATSRILDKAKRYMTKGYQKELTYRRSAGSYSAFGNRDKAGSMWLTAFVVKCFSQAKPFIYIDPKVTQPSIDWIIKKQNSDGTFQEPGRVIHKAMKGGVTNDITLAAFVLIAMQESGVTSSSVTSAITKTQQYLEDKISTISSSYTMAIVNYALTLTRSTAAKTAFAKLKQMAMTKDGATYWSAVKEAGKQTGRWYPPYGQSNSLNIEATSYALMTYVLNKELAAAAPIAKWLSMQRNSMGGFSSTQDTCVALEALSRYAAMVYGSDLNADIYIRSTNNTSFLKHFKINNANAVVLQQTDVPAGQGDIMLEANGTGIGLVQLGVQYYVVKDPLDQSFEVEVTVLDHSTTEIIYVKSCGRWNSGGTSGMAIMEIGVPSGFSANQNKLREIVKSNTLSIKRYEMSGSHVVLYFDELTNNKKCVTVMMERTVPVGLLKPVPVKVFDYYEPEKQASAFYKVSKLSTGSLCNACSSCVGCTSGSAKSSYSFVLIALITLLLANMY